MSVWDVEKLDMKNPLCHCRFLFHIKDANKVILGAVDDP